MFRGLSRSSRRQAFPHMNAGLLLPRAGILLYLGRPNLEAADVPIGDDTEIGDATIIRWMFLLPADADIRAATGWVSGVGNVFYDAAGDPIAVLASEIVAWSSINQWNVLFHLVSADTETGRLAIYAQDTPLETLNKALKMLREDQIDVSPSAFFNGMDFRLATYTGGPTYVPDHLGVLRSPGANKPACKGFRLDGTTYLNADESGNPIITSTPQKTVTYNTDWTAKTFAETFEKFDTSDPLKAPGWLCEPARTNRVTARKAIPTDTTGISVASGTATVSLATEKTALISAAGLGGTCTLGNLYKVVATTDSVITISGTAGATGTFSISSFLACEAGTASLRFDGVDRGSIISSPLLVRYKAAGIATLNSTTVMALKVFAGSRVYFILPQLEEGAFCTSPICKAADGSDPLTALTRAGTVLTYPTAGKIRSNNMAFRMIVVPRAIDSSYPNLFGLYVDSSNRFQLYFNGTSVVFEKRIAGVSASAPVASIAEVDKPLQIVFLHYSSYGIQVATRKYSSGSWGSWITSSVNATSVAKLNQPIPVNFQFGANGNSIQQLTGNISLFDCVPIPSGITDPLAWAKTHWGVA